MNKYWIDEPETTVYNYDVAVEFYHNKKMGFLIWVDSTGQAGYAFLHPTSGSYGFMSKEFMDSWKKYLEATDQYIPEDQQELSDY